jgi:hypothetical protein
MNSIPILFILLNFLIGFFSDIGLNITNLVPSLKPYFKNRTIIGSALYAGLTILIALLITMLLSSMIFGFLMPLQMEQFYKFIALTAIVGYIADWYIYKAKVFGSDLDEYYKSLGIGFWGSAAFVFSVVTSYLLIKLVGNLRFPYNPSLSYY